MYGVLPECIFAYTTGMLYLHRPMRALDLLGLKSQRVTSSVVGRMRTRSSSRLGHGSSPTCGFLIALYSQQKAGNYYYESRKAKTHGDGSSKGAKLQDKQHNVATWKCCEFCLVFHRTISMENKTSSLELHGSGLTYCLLLS